MKLESLSEEMRILYVAFTRAKEKLIITGAVASFEKASVKWCSAAAAQSDSFDGYTSEQYEGIPEYEVIKGRSYLDWIGMALAKHKMGDIIRETAGSDVNITKFHELSTWNLKIWHKSDIIVDKNLETVDEFSKEKELFTEGISEGEYAEEIKRRLDWQYPYMLASKIATNISVSELKRRALDDGNEQNVVDLYKAQAVRKPLFLQEEKGLSASEKGTALHSVMQHLDLNRVSKLEEIELQFMYFIEKEFLTREEINAVKSEKILSFFNSAIGKRLLKTFKNTGKVYREIPFYIDIPGTVISKELSEDIYKDEKVRIQGIIDCYFEEEDGNIVLLDYKTDYVGSESNIDAIKTIETIKAIKKRYEIQIKYYSETLMEMTEKKINEKYLYLFSVNRFIEME